MELSITQTIKIVFGAFVVLILVVFLMLQMGLVPLDPSERSSKKITVTDCSGNTLTSAEVTVSKTLLQKYIGLSRTSTLPEGEGMLFTHQQDQDRTIVMRNMDFSLDIIFVGENGKIRQISRGDEPRSLMEYYLTYDSVTGQAMYILEMNENWADENNVSTGACIEELGS